MGWAVGWDSDKDRFRGYGVPAFCDAKGCEVKIDRGFGYACRCEKCHPLDVPICDGPAVFVCDAHTCADVDWSDVPEHPEWVAHILTDSSWRQWRDENQDRVTALEGDEHACGEDHDPSCDGCRVAYGDAGRKP